MVVVRAALGALLCAALIGCATAPAPVVQPAASYPTYVSTGPDADEVRRLELRGAAVNVEGWSIEEARAFFAPEWVSVQPNA